MMAVHNPTVFLYFQQSSIPDSFSWLEVVAASTRVI
jgi:hypothetical protein